MIIEREENWGTLRYDTSEHRFSYVKTDGKDTLAYAQEPVVLNVDLTLKCNMACRHCVAKDFVDVKDLEVTEELIGYINESPFMVIVITGGEPLLPECERELLKLVQSVKRKGIIIDTNGTIMPSDKLISSIIKNEILVRVSWDSVRPQDEIYFRQVKKDMGQYINMGQDPNMVYYMKKIGMINDFRSKGINVAIQSVLHIRNLTSINEMPILLSDLKIKKWYIQRFIPSYKVANERNLDIPTNKYEIAVTNLSERCRPLNIEFIAKKDRRHNSVFLLVGDGIIYTQDEKPGQKIPLGSYKDFEDLNDHKYFEYVSRSDHSERYYG